MRVVKTKVYKFDELSDKAKEKARDWYRDGGFDYDWWDFVYEDAAQIAGMLGIELRQKPVNLMSGKTRYDPCIYFSGFSSQGDGACFEGTYRYKAGSSRTIRSHAPTDKELHRIAEALLDEQRKHLYKLTASIKQRGYYNHSGCMDIEVDKDGNGEFDAEAIRQPMRDFADWIYKNLEDKWNYQNADEQVDDTILANGYEFEEDGTRA